MAREGDVITIEMARRVWREEELFLFSNCDRTELAMIFDIAEKKKSGDLVRASSAMGFFKEGSEDLLDWTMVTEALRVIEKHTVVKGNTVYDQLNDGSLVRRYA
jgi:hypothetical protein